MFWLLVIINLIRFLVLAAIFCTLSCGYSRCSECHAIYIKSYGPTFSLLQYYNSVFTGSLWNEPQTVTVLLGDQASWRKITNSCFKNGINKLSLIMIMIFFHKFLHNILIMNVLSNAPRMVLQTTSTRTKALYCVSL